MIERLRDLLDLSPGAVLDDWFELEARMHTYVITFDTALRVKQRIEQIPQPDWVEFTDLFGAKQSVRSQDVHRISESTPTTRAAVHAFMRARQTERQTKEKSDEQPAGA